MKNKTTFSIHRGLIAFFFGILFCFAPLSGQNVQDTIIAYFNLLEKVPQEKLYLHLDKPFYGAGEKIWFKGYLVNSVTHQGNKIRRDSLGFHNAFPPSHSPCR